MAYFDKYGVEYSDDRKTLVKCPTDFHGDYTIISGTEEVEAQAFYECSGLETLSIPDSVTKIEEWAFHECVSPKERFSVLLRWRN